MEQIPIISCKIILAKRLMNWGLVFRMESSMVLVWCGVALPKQSALLVTQFSAPFSPFDYTPHLTEEEERDWRDALPACLPACACRTEGEEEQVELPAGAPALPHNLI